MYEIIYYAANGREPVYEWLDSLDVKMQAVIQDKIGSLHRYGLMVLRTNVMKRIEGNDKDFFELRGGNCRIAFFHETDSDSFVLLHGFLKKRLREVREIAIARTRLHEYLSRR